MKNFCFRLKERWSTTIDRDRFGFCEGQDCPLFISGSEPGKYCLDIIKLELEVMKLQKDLMEEKTCCQHEDKNKNKNEKKISGICLRCKQEHKEMHANRFCHYCWTFKTNECEKILKSLKEKENASPEISP